MHKVLLKDYIFYFDIKSAAAEFFASPKSCLLICRWFNAAKVIEKMQKCKRIDS